MPVEPPELEDFEAAIGTDRHCQRPDAYSRVSIRKLLGKLGQVVQCLSQTPGTIGTFCVNWIGPPLD